MFFWRLRKDLLVMVRVVRLLVNLGLFYTISYGTLEIARFIGLVVPLAATIYFRAGVLLLLFLVTFPVIRFRFKKLPREFILIYGTYLAFIFFEAILGIAFNVGAKGVSIEALRVLITTGTIIIIYNYFAFKRPSEDPLSGLLRPYFFLCLYISFTGVIAWLLINFNLVNPEAWRLPQGFQKLETLHVQSSGLNIYSMPYGLGIVMESRGFSFLGITFFRATGLAREPHMATLFVAPALFIIPLVFDTKAHGQAAKFCLITIILFLIAVHSFTTLFVFLVIGLLAGLRVGVRNLLTFQFKSRKKHGSIALIIIVSVGLGYIVLHDSSSISKLLNYDFRSGIDTFVGNTDDLILIGPGIRALGHEGQLTVMRSIPRPVVSLLGQFLHIGFFGMLLLKMFFSKDPYYWIAGGSIYVLLHSLKSFTHIVDTPFYAFVLFVSALMVYRSRKLMCGNKPFEQEYI